MESKHTLWKIRISQRKTGKGVGGGGGGEWKKQTRNKGTEKQPENINKTVLESPYLSIIALNINGPNSPTKMYSVANWIKNEDPTICSLQEIHFSFEDTHKLRVKAIYFVLSFFFCKMENILRIW